MRVLVRFWHNSDAKLCCFINDDLGTSARFDIAKVQPDIVRASLRDSGFVANDDKSVWEPTQVNSRLGVVANLGSGFLWVTDAQDSSILSFTHYILVNAPFTPARRLSKLTGMLLSTNLSWGTWSG